MDTAISVLPASIAELYLYPVKKPESIMMSAFQRFTNLHLLALDKCPPLDSDYDSYSISSEEEDPDDLSMFLAVFNYDLYDSIYKHATCNLILDSTFVTLQTLKTEGNFCCCLANEAHMGACFPSLRSLSTTLVGDPEGIRLAQQITIMPNLQELKLKVLSFYYSFACVLYIPSTSFIQHLK